MYYEDIHLRDYLRVILKWRWMIVAVFVLVVIAASIYSFRQIPLYQSTARILIERSGPNIVSFADPNASNNLYWDPQFIETQINIIKSSAVAERILQKPELRRQIIHRPSPTASDTKPVSTFSLTALMASVSKFLGKQESPPLSKNAQAAVKEEGVIKLLLGMIRVSPVEESRLVDVSVTSINPEQAALLANTVVEGYIEHNREARSAASRNAVRWLVNEVETARKKVAESETVLQQYKEEHKIIALEGRQSIITQKLADLSAALSQARIQRMAQESHYQELQGLRQKELNSVPMISRDPVIRTLKVTLLDLEREHLELLKKFREKHPNVAIVKSQITGIQNQIAGEIRRIVNGIKNDYEMAWAEEQILEEAMEALKLDALEFDQKTIFYEILEKEVQSNRRIYHALLERMNETSVTERLETTNIQLVDRATIPHAPIAPNNRRTLQMAAFLGAVLSIALAFFLEYWNDTISTPEELKQHLDIPFLGIIPKVPTSSFRLAEKKSMQENIVATIVQSDPQSSLAEAYRGLRTHITFTDICNEELPAKLKSSLLFTSAEPSEGKSCTVANLGITMAQSGRKTLIIDCDFRKPRIDRIFAVEEPCFGLANILMDHDTDISASVVNAIIKTTIPQLYLLPCGTIPPNPSDLLSLEKTRAIVTELEKYYDQILIDSPPINVVTDPLILSKFVSGVVVILHAGKTKRHVAERAVDELYKAEATILGGVLNNVDLKKAKYHHYYYSAYHYPKYYRKEEKKSAKKAKTAKAGSA
ncbi:MAG: polysaccharide biosynthesis tyrosine autokinase [bacterium]|nr:polysaccharide biosynthesis tyrosine autokinase [bacterium]